MKRSSIIINVMVAVLLLIAEKSYAVTLSPNNPNLNKINLATNTPSPSPTGIILQLKPGLNKLPLVTLGAKSTVTPTPTLGTKDTVTPTSNATETGMPNETGKATDAGTVTTATAANASAPAGIQTKDIVTYVLIGAILLVLLAQAFWPKKNNGSETKPEEPKTEETKTE